MLVNRLDRASKDETYRGNDRSDAATPSRANSKDTRDDVCNRRAKCNNVCGKHPLRNLLVSIQTILDLLREDACSASPVQIPHFHRIEPEIGLAIRALCQLDSVSAVLASRAVIPEVDFVDVVKWLITAGRNEGVDESAEFRVDFIQSCCEASRRCYVVFEVCGIGLDV